jgi:septal ring factor EnvC (AmiA/AmiB activator)
MKFSKVNQKQVSKEMLPRVINRIFSICKTDKNFPLRDQIGRVDVQIEAVKQKIRKQNDLFKQSKQLTHNLNERLNMLEQRNADLKERLIESLGSEL